MIIKPFKTLRNYPITIMLTSRKTRKQFVKFLLIGGCAFLIDAGILHVGIKFFDLPALTSRIFSFITAVTFTWVMNHRFTFNIKQPLRLIDFITYISTQSIGLTINFTVYVLCIWLWDLAASYPMVALVPATGFAMIANFVLMKKLVFK